VLAKKQDCPLIEAESSYRDGYQDGYIDGTERREAEAALVAPDPAPLDPWVDGYEAGEYEARASLDVERLARALHAASWGCESGPAQAADFIYHQGHAAVIAREYAKDPQP